MFQSECIARAKMVVAQEYFQPNKGKTDCFTKIIEFHCYECDSFISLAYFITIFSTSSVELFNTMLTHTNILIVIIGFAKVPSIYFRSATKIEVKLFPQRSNANIFRVKELNQVELTTRNIITMVYRMRCFPAYLCVYVRASIENIIAIAFSQSVSQYTKIEFAAMQTICILVERYTFYESGTQKKRGNEK